MIIKGPFGTFEGTFDECIRVARIHAGLRAHLNGVEPPLMAARAPITISERLALALDRFHRLRPSPPRVAMLVSASYADEFEREVEHATRFASKPDAPRSAIKGFAVYGVEVVPDLNVPKNVAVFVDPDRKFLGAVVLE